MKKNTLVGVIVAGVCAIGAAIGIGALMKKGNNEEDVDGAETEEETNEEVESEEEEFEG